MHTATKDFCIAVIIKSWVAREMMMGSSFAESRAVGCKEVRGRDLRGAPLLTDTNMTVHPFVRGCDIDFRDPIFANAPSEVPGLAVLLRGILPRVR